MGDGYFIFDHGENAVMHFKLKEAPQWKFGVWLTKFKERKPRDERSSGDYINIRYLHKTNYGSINSNQQIHTSVKNLMYIGVKLTMKKIKFMLLMKY